MLRSCHAILDCGLSWLRDTSGMCGNVCKTGHYVSSNLGSNFACILKIRPTCENLWQCPCGLKCGPVEHGANASRGEEVILTGTAHGERAYTHWISAEMISWFTDKLTDRKLTDHNFDNPLIVEAIKYKGKTYGVCSFTNSKICLLSSITNH